ncbi:MAG: glycyl-radical enzyme activating protein [Desulfitobacterium hafniense]|nr:glycyl-radical enzyme activating protein [Desulfitobacterium hafniense]
MKTEKAVGVVFNTQGYSIHDGPGIRTIIFLKGCPLKCEWCSNPESQSDRPEVISIANRCIGCGRCVEGCPEKAIFSISGIKTIDRKKCTSCGHCADLCYANSLQMRGQIQTTEEVLREIVGDLVFYQNSGGGVTISGGEPFYQAEFTLSLLKASKELGLNTVVETCGYALYKKIAACLPYIDLLYFDLKHLNGEVHKRYTGVDNTLILNNARRLGASGVKMVVRLPIIPGYNDSEENLKMTAEFTCSIGVNEIHLLPYHIFGSSKYYQLGREYRLNIKAPDENRMTEIQQLMTRNHLKIYISGR